MHLAAELGLGGDSRDRLMNKVGRSPRQAAMRWCLDALGYLLHTPHVWRSESTACPIKGASRLVAGLVGFCGGVRVLRCLCLGKRRSSRGRPCRGRGKCSL